jgi:general secretion pathway protein K
MRSRRDNRGFALLAVFWIAMLLSLLALNYATTARLNAEAARNRRLSLKRNYLFEAAFDRGYHEYLKYRANRALLRKKAEYEEQTGHPLELWYPRAEPWSCKIDGLAVEIKLVDEAGKFQINRLPATTLRRVVEACGLKDESRRDTVVDSLLDWIDGDDLHHLNGAEKDWYEAQGLDYGCKNRPIDVVNELLLVRGVTPELFAGGRGRPGLVDFLSPYGAPARLDINSCTPAAFRLVGELPEDVVAGIVAKRKEGPISKLAELSEIVPAEDMSLLQRWFTVASSNYVTIAVRSVDGGVDQGWRRRVFPAVPARTGRPR